MILTCPECRTRYLVDPANLRPSGRTVRCGKCQHTWREASPPDSALSVEPIPIAVEPRPIAPGSNLPALTRPPPRRSRAGWLLVVLILAIMIVGAVLGRDRIVQALPQAAQLYSALGMPAEAVGAGLDFRNVASKRETDGDATVLVVSGQVANVSKDAKDVPLLQGTLHDAHNQVVRQWSFPAKDNRLAPGAVTSFETRLRNPPADATGLTIGFAGT